MRIFVYEYTCAEADADLPASLRQEGWAMLSAVLADLSQINGVEVATLLAPSIEQDCRGATVIHSTAGDCKTQFQVLARSADFTLVIAPESQGLLGERARWVADLGGRLLGPSVEAIRLTSDKLTVATHWKRHGVPTPPTWPLASLPEAIAPPLVCKPRDGAGSQATFLVKDRSLLSDIRAQAEADGWTGEMIAQPLIPGTAASVALILGASQTFSCPPAAQHLSGDGRFRYQGGELPLPPHLTIRAASLAARAASMIPGLRGYVGIDLILGEANDGSADFAIELNPRLTTSYVGLRTLSQINLSEVMLKAALGESLPPPRWKDERVRFLSNGTINFL